MTVEGTQWLMAVPKPVVVLSADAAVVFANQRFADLVREPADDLAKLASVVEDDPVLKAAARRAIASVPRDVGCTEFRWAAEGRDGPELVAQLSRAGDDRFVVVLDLPGEGAEIEVIQSFVRRYLDGLLNRLPLGLLVIDADLRVTFCNQRQLELLEALGLPMSLVNVVGTPIGDIYPVFDRGEWPTLVESVRRTRDAISRTRVQYPASDPTHYLHAQLLPFSIGPGHPPQTICVTEDATRVVELEQELVRQERLAVAGQLVAQFHHEINNPLVAILGMAEMMLHRSALDEDVSGRVIRIRNGALRIAEVTKKMRAVLELEQRAGEGEVPNLPDLSVRPSA